MVKVYAIVLAIGVSALIAWIFAHAYATSNDKPERDPEATVGIRGRRVVAGLVGFGMAGMSAEFSPRDISWPIALVLALVGSGALMWYAGWVDLDEAATGGSAVSND